MNLGLEGRTAIVCGSTAGLGFSCAQALAREGAAVVVNGRTQTRVDEAVGRIAQFAESRVMGVAADVSTPEGREELLRAAPEADILVNNAGGPPAKPAEDWSEGDMDGALATNMVAPILLATALLPGMRARQWGRVVNICSASLKAPMPLLGLSNGARSGLVGVMSGLARENGPFGITINNLLPGYFATSRFEEYAGALARSRGSTQAQVVADLEHAVPARRIGRPEEFGMICAFLCSQASSYINAQNIVIDGGAYPGLF